MNASDTYPVHERFHAFQGEGRHMGVNAFFIRLFGCPVHCPWCDSAGTWHPNHIPKDISKMTASALVKEVRESGAESCIITGGEPCVHDLNPLVDALDRAHVAAHLETSGAFPIRGSVTWTVLSPKRWKLPINETVMRADEFKFIIETPEDIQFYHNLLFPSGEDSLLREVWLHPEWSKRQDPTVLKAISDAVKSKENKSRRFRAGWQLHKMYQCDLLDDRSKDPVPLGGDEKRGY